MPRCFYCHRPISGPVLNAGGDVGACHPGCFRRADDEDERIGLEAGRWRRVLPLEPEQIAALDDLRRSERKSAKRAEPTQSARREAAAAVLARRSVA